MKIHNNCSIINVIINTRKPVGGPKNYVFSWLISDEKSNEPRVSESGEAGWDVDDADLEIPDLGPAPAAESSDSYVHLPAQG